MTLKRLWSILTTLGPAPIKTEGPKSLESSDHGMFDGGEEEGGEEPETPEEPGEEAEEPEEGKDEDDPKEPEEGTGEESDEDDDEETGDTDSDDDEGEDDEDADAGEDDTAMALRETWETRLEADARANPESAPRLPSSTWGLREAAKKKFDELRSKDEDGKLDAEAIFEIALDASLQVVGSYHDGVAAPAGDRIEKSVRNVQVGRTLTSFRKDAGERLTPAVEQKMATLYQGFASKYGWKRADKVPLKTLFRMAGGSLKGKPAKSPAKSGAEDTATRQKRAALGASSGPRALGRTRAEDGAGKPRKEDRALREFSKDTRARAPFFTLE